MANKPPKNWIFAYKDQRYWFIMTVKYPVFIGVTGSFSIIGRTSDYLTLIYQITCIDSYLRIPADKESVTLGFNKCELMKILMLS